LPPRQCQCQCHLFPRNGIHLRVRLLHDEAHLWPRLLHCGARPCVPLPLPRRRVTSNHRFLVETLHFLRLVPLTARSNNRPFSTLRPSLSRPRTSQCTSLVRCRLHGLSRKTVHRQFHRGFGRFAPLFSAKQTSYVRASPRRLKAGNTAH
jgi:hypothetical protein